MIQRVSAVALAWRRRFWSTRGIVLAERCIAERVVLVHVLASANVGHHLRDRTRAVRWKPQQRYCSIPARPTQPLRLVTCRGSSASRSPSPMKLIDTTARKMKSPGKIAIHGAWFISLGASLSMLPQLGVGGWIPSPRNDSVLSEMIAAATPSVAATMIGASEFGRM